MIRLNLEAKFIFDSKVQYKGTQANEHIYRGINNNEKFVFTSDNEFQLKDILINDASLKKHMENSVNYFDYKKPFTKDVFYSKQKTLELPVYECDWLCTVGPFSRWKVANQPESGPSDTFYYITWFGHSRPGTNIEIEG